MAAFIDSITKRMCVCVGVIVWVCGRLCRGCECDCVGDW